MVESRLTRVVLRVLAWLTVGFIWAPLLVIAIYAFNASRSQSWPIRGLTLEWFGRAAADDGVREAILASVLAAAGATIIALVLGTLVAIAVARFRFFGRDTISFLVVLPIALPGVVTGMALGTTFRTFGIDLGLATVIVGHATFCVVLAYNNVVARLRRLSKSYEEASMDLGADTWVTFRRILLPGIRSALLSGGLLAFALSFDEVIVTSFTAGAGVQTVPLWVLANFSRPNAIPVVNVVALALVIVSIVPVYLAQRFGGDAVAVTR